MWALRMRLVEAAVSPLPGSQSIASCRPSRLSSMSVRRVTGPSISSKAATRTRRAGLFRKPVNGWR